MTGLKCLLAAAALTASLVAAHASPLYLVGAQVYRSGSSGENVGAEWQLSTNSGTGHSPLYVALDTDVQDHSISFLLSEGANIFTYYTAFNASEIGLNLFFNTTGAPYDPPYLEGDPGIPGQLTAYVSAGSSAFGIPAANTLTGAYNAGAVLVAAYSGATSFTVGDRTVRITGFDADSGGMAGTFALTVEQGVPEPTTLFFVGLGLLALTRMRKSGGSVQ